MTIGTTEDEFLPWLRSLDECRSQTLLILAIAQLALSWLLVAPYIIALSTLGWSILSLFGGALVALIYARTRYDLAAGALVLSQLLGATLAIRAIDVVLTEWSLSLVVATTTVLLGTNWALGIATLASAELLWNAGGPIPWTNTLALQGLAMIWVIAFITWLGLRPLKQSLAWAMNSHLDARSRAEEAERHRGELGRTVKSLSETHERLERLTAELARARLTAENARALKAKFAAYVSHELRTPLNLIIGFSEMMVLAPQTYGGEVLPAAYRGDINAIYQSARHLSTLINDVLDLSQIDAHRMALDRDDAPIDEVIHSAVGTVEAAYAEKNLTIAVESQPNLPILYIDRTRIRQVLINLLANALRFTESGGVKVAVRRERSDVIVSVSDSGIGIPEAELPRLFEDFRQAERPDQDAGEGNGLGLAIARRFVGLHGGWMKAESTNGQGTTVSFALPTGHSFVDGATQISGNGWETSSVTGPSLPVVAVADDDPWLLRVLQRYLDGYRILATRADAKINSRKWQQEGVSALIVSTADEQSSWEQLDSLSRTFSPVPVIGLSLRGHREAIERLGVADYLDKPITMDRLRAVLERWGPKRGSQTILVVDDDHNMVRLLTRMIQSSSRRYHVLKAYDGATALDAMRKTPPDLVMLDLLMPVVNGYEVLVHMRHDDCLKDIPVVVVSARGGEDDAIVTGMFGLARSGGFPAGELMRCLQATLDNLNAQGAAASLPVPATMHLEQPV